MSALSWSELCERPELQDLPFKIETDDEGHIIMTPTKNYHGFFQVEIAARLRAYPGKVITECAVWTPKGTKVPDVAWMTEATFAIVKDEAECSVCPGLCVEVLSDSNTPAERHRKRQVYFEQGANEVWECSKDGEMTFYRSDGARGSRLFPDFPATISM